MRYGINVFVVLVIALWTVRVDGVSDIDYGDARRYDVIVAKKPFGIAAPAKRDPKSLQPEPGSPQDPLKAIRVVGLTYKEPFGLRVGVVDSGSNPAANYLLSIGERTESGVTVMEADLDLEAVLLRTQTATGQTVERWFYLGGGGIAPGIAQKEADIVASPMPRLPMRQQPAQTNKPAESYIERMRKRREAMQARVKEPPSLQGAELEKHLQEYNLELIRKAAKGEPAGPPLPIQLTPEQDQKLVEEGVLPPQE